MSPGRGLYPRQRVSGNASAYFKGKEPLPLAGVGRRASGRQGGATFLTLLSHHPEGSHTSPNRKFQAMFETSTTVEAHARAQPM